MAAVLGFHLGQRARQPWDELRYVGANSSGLFGIYQYPESLALAPCNSKVSICMTTEPAKHGQDTRNTQQQAAGTEHND